jgi:hypothetical protein
MSFEDLDAMAQYDWPVAAPQAYPVFGRTTLPHAIVLPAKADLRWMEGALAGLVAYVKGHLERRRGGGHPADVTLSVVPWLLPCAPERRCTNTAKRAMWHTKGTHGQRA